LAIGLFDFEKIGSRLRTNFDSHDCRASGNSANSGQQITNNKQPDQHEHPQLGKAEKLLSKLRMSILFQANLHT
jgi:hypothetical protein